MNIKSKDKRIIQATKLCNKIQASPVILQMLTEESVYSVKV